jgi:uncharacterized protein (DUF2236 family)
METLAFRPGSSARRLAQPSAGRVSWMLQREIILLLAWGPAILLQLAHPLVARGVAEHSAFSTERWGRARRLHRTVDAMLRLCFGPEPEARVVVARINAIHDQVHGTLSETSGIFPAGTVYSARDPALLTWVHATLIHMNVRVYELFVGSLPHEDRDRYCVEASAIEAALGIPEGRVPRSEDELRRYMDAMLANGEISVTETARTLARAIMYPEAPRLAAPAFWLMRQTIIGLLPPAIRRGYGFSWSVRSESRFRRAAGLVRALLPLTPSVLRYWPAARAVPHGGPPRGCPLSGVSRHRPQGDSGCPRGRSGSR